MKEITLEATLENITRVTAWIDEALEALDCPLKAQMQIDVAIDELFGNIAHYAYSGKTGMVTVRFDHDAVANAVSITFIDQGVPFDPLSQDDPDTTLGADERKIGGLGIFLVKKTMDALNYQFRDGKNILSLKKKL